MELQNLQMLLSNLNHAIRNKETVTIGGGTFSGKELEDLRDAVKEKIHAIHVRIAVNESLTITRSH